MRLFLLLTLCSCAEMTIHDFTLCSDQGVSGASCDNYLTDHQVLLDKTEWDALRFGWVCMSPSDFGNIKAELEQACSIASCSYEQLQTMQNFFRKVQSTQP